MFDIGPGEAVVLGILALLIFGERLPQFAQQAGRALRQLRQMAMSAQSDLKDGLGSDFGEFDPRDLHPKNFVRKHLFEGEDDPLGLNETKKAMSVEGVVPQTGLQLDERPPFDAEAT